MASAWGASWGDSWGDSWGGVASVPAVVVPDGVPLWWWNWNRLHWSVPAVAGGARLRIGLRLYAGTASAVRVETKKPKAMTGRIRAGSATAQFTEEEILLLADQLTEDW